MLAWTNTKIYTRHTSQHLMLDIRHYVQGSLPLYGICRRKLCDYAKSTNLDPFEAFNYYNSIKTQRDIRRGRFNKTNVKQMQAQFLELIRSMDMSNPASTSNLSKVRSFFKSVEGPFNYAFTNIIKLKEYASLPQPCQLYIQQLHTINQNTQKDIQDRANAFEVTLANYLTSKGLVFRTEHDIRRDKDYTVTPDILFDTPITIQLDGHTHTIHWLDAKNYTLTNTPHLITGVKQQAAKYNRIFGRGAMVFHYGFDKSIKIPSTLILDGSSLDDDDVANPCDTPIETD